MRKLLPDWGHFLSCKRGLGGLFAHQLIKACAERLVHSRCDNSIKKVDFSAWSGGEMYLKPSFIFSSVFFQLGLFLLVFNKYCECS